MFKDKKRRTKKNTGADFEKQVYETINKTINTGNFFMSLSNVKVFHKKGYYSIYRNKDIITDISIEIYVDNPVINPNIAPSIIIVVECKDYSHPLPVDDVEEFHAKLQQIGADNTKGVIITRKPMYQESAINYARSNGIMIKAFNESEYVCYESCPSLKRPLEEPVNHKESTAAYIRYNDKLIKLLETETYIGRKTEFNNIIIHDRCVSGQHCLIYKNEKEEYVIQDCNSVNGTYINGKKIIHEEILCNGDFIYLGNEKIEFILE